MKKTTTMIVALMLCVGAVASAEQNTKVERARSLYQQGMIAMKEGKFDLAKMSFKEVLRIYPNHPQARGKLLYISNNRNSLDIKRRKDTLRKVTIPEVNLDKATVREALDFLTAVVERESKKTVTPNFIIQDPTGAFTNSRVTLRLNRIPAETLLRYIVGQAGGHIRYDNHAVVITPRKKATTKAAAPKIEQKPDFSE